MTDIIDSHCHAWTTWPYEPAVPDPDSRGRVEQLLWEMDQSGVAQAVLICAGIAHNPANNAYVAASVASHTTRLHQFADFDSLWLPEYHTKGAPDRLRRLLDTYPLKGITHYLKPDNDGWLTSPDARECLQIAAEHRLILSLSAPVSWQADIQALAAAFPSVPILCHHLAWIRTAPIPAEDALRQVLAGARLPNLLIKLSGFGYGDPRPWDVPHTAAHPIVRAMHETFGPNRLVWGSDYPVLRRHMTYRQALEAVRCVIPAQDHPAIMGGTMRHLLENAGNESNSRSDGTAVR